MSISLQIFVVQNVCQSVIVVAGYKWLFLEIQIL